MSNTYVNTYYNSFFRFKRNLLRCAVAFSVVYNIPRYFEMVTKEDPQSKLLRIESTKMRQNPIYISLYVFWSKLILVREIKKDYMFALMYDVHCTSCFLIRQLLQKIDSSALPRNLTTNKH